ncbi:MAG TPA: copper transporter, partial [Actinomycetota bacterium]|nr:copper transporter [Actinomycetota bacterium]
MISFRFHLVSLIAVFLALGLGIITGTTVINRAIVSQLEDQTNRLVAQEAENRAAITRLQAEVDTATAFAEQAAGYLVDGALEQESVAVVTEEATDPDAITAAQTALTEAGAEVVALLALDDALSALNESQRTQLGAALGFEADGDAGAFGAQIASALANRLAFGVRPGQPDVLATLISEGYL